MNGKFEDKLAQLAFGEITGDEAARIEAQAKTDPEALRVLATYRSMKGGLTNLSEVPEDQLSKERLRHAILMSGLKPQPIEKASPWGWLWMPATAALVAAGLMMFNGQRQSNEPMVAINDFDLGKSQVAMNVPKTFDFGAKPSMKKAEPKRTLVAVEKPKARIRRTVEPEPEYSAMELDFGDSIDKFRPNIVVSNNSEDRSPTTKSVDSAQMEPASSGNGIVIIEDNRDESTGAYRATEVGTASNVLIGG